MKRPTPLGKNYLTEKYTRARTYLLMFSWVKYEISRYFGLVSRAVAVLFGPEKDTVLPREHGLYDCKLAEIAVVLLIFLFLSVEKIMFSSFHVLMEKLLCKPFPVKWILALIRFIIDISTMKVRTISDVIVINFKICSRFSVKNPESHFVVTRGSNF